MGGWQVESLRTTFFCSAQEENDPRLWERLVGGPAEVIDIRPQQGVSTFTGRVDGIQLQVIVAVGRVDLNAQPALSVQLGLPVQPDPPVAFHLPDPEAALASLTRIATAWADSTASIITRLAFGAELTVPVDNLEEGYRGLGRYLPPLAALYDSETTELLCQINRPRQSEVNPDLRINRVTSWSVQQLSSLELTLAPAGVQQIATTVTQHTQRLTLDISTDAQLGPLEDASALLGELVAHASSIASGDY